MQRCEGLEEPKHAKNQLEERHERLLLEGAEPHEKGCLLLDAEKPIDLDVKSRQIVPGRSNG